MTAPRLRRTHAALLGLAALQACVFVPRTTQVYDAECRTLSRRMELQEVQVAAIGGCRNDGCAALVLAAGVVSAASAVVSGTIVISGNIAYWLEKQTQCRPASPAPADSAPARAPLSAPDLPSGG
jgi:hypothetical protein